MEIIPYTDAFAQDLIALLTELQNHEAKLHDSRPAGGAVAASYLEFMLTRCRNQRGAVLVAVRQQRAVGFVSVHLEQEAAEDSHLHEEYKTYGVISDLCVSPGQRRQNLATLLMQAAEKYLETTGVSVVQVSALSANEAARAFYQSQGYSDYEVTLLKRL